MGAAVKDGRRRCGHCETRPANARYGLCSVCVRREDVRARFRPPPPVRAAYGSACRHCVRGRVTRPRGLCWTCYYTPGVKEKYGPAYQGVMAGEGGGYALPAEPTDAPPGSDEKIRVMAERAAAGTGIFHPDDRLSQPEDSRVDARSRYEPGGRAKRAAATEHTYHGPGGV